MIGQQLMDTSGIDSGDDQFVVFGFLDILQGFEKGMRYFFGPSQDANYFDEENSSQMKSFFNCHQCKMTMSYISEYLHHRLTQTIVVKVMEYQCKNRYNPAYCEQLLKIYSDIVIDNIYAILVNENFICEQILPICDEQNYIQMSQNDYITQVLRDKPQNIQDDDFLDKIYDLIEKEKNYQTYKVLQISDWHVDFRYEEGTNKYCEEEVCCQEAHGFAEKEEDKARKYGELTCDIPINTAEKQIEWLSKNEKPDLILWTGDSSSHDLHNLKATDVRDTIKTLSDMIYSYFPDVPVVPALGNHDFHPPNYQKFNESFSNHLMEISKIFSIFLDQNTLDQFQEYGYYKYDLPESFQDNSIQKVSIISINTQSCYNMNFGLWSEKNDAGQQLGWLQNQLKQAEQEDRVVMIIGHIMPGDLGCIKKWSIRYSSLVERYQHIIRFSTFGHDHRELFEVTRSFSSNKPVHVNHGCGSLGTYMKVNPSARMFTMHAKYHVPVDFKVLEFNLDRANGGNPGFTQFADMRKDFKMKNLSPNEFSKLSERFLINESDAIKYIKFQWKNGPSGDITKCDQDCRKEQHCNTYFGVSDHKLVCNGNNFSIYTVLEYLLGASMNPWVTEQQV